MSQSQNLQMLRRRLQLRLLLVCFAAVFSFSIVHTATSATVSDDVRHVDLVSDIEFEPESAQLDSLMNDEFELPQRSRFCSPSTSPSPAPSNTHHDVSVHDSPIRSRASSPTLPRHEPLMRALRGLDTPSHSQPRQESLQSRPQTQTQPQPSSPVRTPLLQQLHARLDESDLGDRDMTELPDIVQLEPHSPARSMHSRQGSRSTLRSDSHSNSMQQLHPHSPMAVDGAHPHARVAEHDWIDRMMQLPHQHYSSFVFAPGHDADMFEAYDPFDLPQLQLSHDHADTQTAMHIGSKDARAHRHATRRNQHAFEEHAPTVATVEPVHSSMPLALPLPPVAAVEGEVVHRHATRRNPQALLPLSALQTHTTKRVSAETSRSITERIKKHKPKPPTAFDPLPHLDDLHEGPHCELTLQLLKQHFPAEAKASPCCFLIDSQSPLNVHNSFVRAGLLIERKYAVNPRKHLEYERPRPHLQSEEQHLLRRVQEQHDYVRTLVHTLLRKHAAQLEAHSQDANSRPHSLDAQPHSHDLDSKLARCEFSCNRARSHKDEVLSAPAL